jgi:apolipoprotein N-acyltransferase
LGLSNLREFLSRRYVGSIVACAAGMLLSQAFAPRDWWPLAVLSPALLFWLWEGASPRRAAVLGFWYAAGTFTVGTYWLYISIRGFGNAPLPLTLVLMVGLVSIMAAYQTVSGWLAAKYLPAGGMLRYLVGLPALWLLFEWLRSWFLSGFGWLALGYAATDNWLASLAPVIGQFGLGLLFAMMAGALVLLAQGTMRVRAVALAVIAVPFLAGYLLKDVEWTAPSGKPIQVAVVQGAISQDQKWIAANLENILDTYRDLTKTAYGADLIVWPESAAPELLNKLFDWYASIAREAAARRSALVVGTLRQEGEDAYNSVFAVDPLTRTTGFHDKHHLVPFVEFLPVPGFVRNWLRLMELPYSDFRHGAKEQEPLTAAGQKIAAGVCYEDAYGSTQLPALRTATMLVNVTNDAWFGRSSARYQHLQISRLRAMEAGRPMVRAANDGVSAIIDHHGRLVARAPEYEANVMRADLQPRIGLTPYAKVGNWPVVSLCFLLAILAARLRSLQGRNRA